MKNTLTPLYKLRQPANQAYIKPVVGVFVSRSVIRKLLDQNSLFRINELRQANHVAGVELYFFSIKDADINKKTIKGTYYCNDTDKWTQKIFPLPDVMYNRRSAGKISVQVFRDQLIEYGCLLLNPVADFDKWDQHFQLLQHRDIAKHLPVTIPYKNIDSLKEMLVLHDKVYIKPRIGRYSRYVIRVSKLLKGGYEYCYYDKKLVVKYVDSLYELHHRLSTILNGRDSIIQQAIESDYHSQDRITDMRAEVQRNSNGKLEVVAISVRVGDLGSPVTSMRTNASVYSLEKYFKVMHDYTDEQFNRLKGRIVRFLVKIYTGVEGVHGTFGELGIDLVLDNADNPWLIECNAKSAKVALIESYDKKTIRRAFINPLAYAKYLAINKK
ncbi:MULTISPECIES: YheC/YheD family protein [Bacillaceae]|uniref:YheC/YheD family protein n=1 Tax=Evansella alkalicola TaxID=745819 RepID=A0ABS6K1Y5_9BACI|nr:YheC/YheD family protein [Litchfieldia alkalitelluris]MBU9723450.1 YheC/YheD family protein [Bacillus alkalicola]